MAVPKTLHIGRPCMPAASAGRGRLACRRAAGWAGWEGREGHGGLGGRPPGACTPGSGRGKGDLHPAALPPRPRCGVVPRAGVLGWAGGGGGGSEGGGGGGLKGAVGWLGPPLLAGSPYGPRRRGAENSIAFGSAPRREVDSQPFSPCARPAGSQTETHSLVFLSVADASLSSGVAFQCRPSSGRMVMQPT